MDVIGDNVVPGNKQTEKGGQQSGANELIESIPGGGGNN
jgi:hypothetical protein